MNSLSRADEIAQDLKGLTAFERGIARNRIAKYFDGRLSQWDRQVQKTGVVSMGYVLVAYVWLTFAGALDIFACALVFVEHKSRGLFDLEISLFAISGILVAFSLMRWFRGIRVGKVYLDTSKK